MHNYVDYNHINVIVTTTYYCNMNCVYCYNNRDVHEKIGISLETVKKLFEITIPYYKYIHFLWHGGEPLSLGLTFFDKIVKLQNEINKFGTEITNSVQTNLTLLDGELAEFFLENNFSIGSSYDGTMNERTRHNSSKILDGHNLWKLHGGHNGFICVVQKENINCLKEDYEWFKKNRIGYNHNMYLPSFPYENDPLFVNPDYFAEKMCELFDYWLWDDKCIIHLSYFEIILDFILLSHKSVCCYNDCIGKHIGIRPDGSIFGCNRDMPPDFSFGNVNDYNNIRECFDSNGCNEYLRQAIIRRKKCIDTCEIFEFCHGGCNNVALMNGKIDEANQAICQALRLVYKHIAKVINEMNFENEDYSQLNPIVVELIKKGRKFKG